VGVVLSILSLVIMPALAYAKQRTGRDMGSRALVADSKETWVCSYLSLALLVGVGAFALFGWWWADPVGVLAMLPVIVWQGWETFGEADVLADWQGGRFGSRATAAARFVDALTRSPQSLTAEDVQQTRAAGVDDIALAEAVYVAFVFNTINRIVDALGFTHRSDRDRRRGAAILRRNGYRVPKFLLR
jgi:Cation efflux family